MSDKKLENQVLWIVLLLSFFIIFILIFETFNFNEDRVSLLVSTLGAIGAVTAAIAAAKSANVAKMSIAVQQIQFEKSLEPFLVPVMNKFTLKGEVTSLDAVLARWDGKRPEDHVEGGLEIPLINVASGVAKNIVVSFELHNYKEIIQHYNNDASSDEKEILILTVVKDLKLEADIVSMKFDSPKFASSNRLQASNFNKQEFPFIHKEMQEQLAIEIPELFLILNNLSIYNIFTGFSKVEPMLTINITCQDLANKEYEFNYNVFLNEANYNDDFENSNTEIKMLVSKNV